MSNLAKGPSIACHLWDAAASGPAADARGMPAVEGLA
jgi:hypothetical protein